MTCKLAVLAVALWADLCFSASLAAAWSPTGSLIEGQTLTTLMLTITPGVDLLGSGSGDIIITSDDSAWPLAAGGTATSNTCAAGYAYTVNGAVTTVTIPATGCDILAGASSEITFVVLAQNPSAGDHTLRTHTSAEGTDVDGTITIEAVPPTQPGAEFVLSNYLPAQALTQLVFTLHATSGLDEGETITITPPSVDWPWKAEGSADTDSTSGDLCQFIPWQRDGANVVLTLQTDGSTPCTLSPGAALQVTFPESQLGINPAAASYTISTVTSKDMSPVLQNVQITDATTLTPVPSPSPSPSSAAASCLPSLLLILTCITVSQ